MAAGRGPLTVLVEVGDLVPGLRLVQFHRARGDSIDFFQFYGALLPLVGAPDALSLVTCMYGLVGGMQRLLWGQQEWSLASGCCEPFQNR